MLARFKGSHKGGGGAILCIRVTRVAYIRRPVKKINSLSAGLLRNHFLL